MKPSPFGNGQDRSLHDDWRITLYGFRERMHRTLTKEWHGLRLDRRFNAYNNVVPIAPRRPRKT